MLRGYGARAIASPPLSAAASRARPACAPWQRRRSDAQVSPECGSRWPDTDLASLRRSRHLDGRPRALLRLAWCRGAKRRGPSVSGSPAGSQRYAGSPECPRLTLGVSVREAPMQFLVASIVTLRVWAAASQSPRSPCGSSRPASSWRLRPFSRITKSANLRHSRSRPPVAFAPSKPWH